MGPLELLLLAAVGWIAVLTLAVIVCAVARRADERHDDLADLAAFAVSNPPSSPRGFARSGREKPARAPRMPINA